MPSQRVWAAGALSACVGACANVWGFTDVTLGGDASRTEASDASLDRGPVAPEDAGTTLESVETIGRPMDAASPPPAKDAASDDAPGAGDADSESGDDSGSDGNADGGVCNGTTCRGCCAADGTCIAGTDNAGCGTGGAACADCADAGRVCSAGSCVSTTCDVSACTNTCVPFFTPCCKADGTCGCGLTFPAGTCN